MKIYGFIHVGIINNWEPILKEQIRKINKGLYTTSEEIYIGSTGDRSKLLQLEFENKYKFINEAHPFEAGEIPTLNSLHDFCLNTECYVWYIHTKGVTRPDNVCVQDWRKCMEYFVVKKYKNCISSLQCHDACGVLWYDKDDPRLPYQAGNKPHFSGNFWWARSDYIRSLPKLENNRREAEFLVGTNNPKIKCFHYSYLDHYKTRYPASNYIKF